MSLLSLLEISLSSAIFILFVVFIASIVRGFNGFGFSAICVSGFSFVLPTIEIVPVILILEVLISIFMIPYVWNKVDWKFVFQLLIGIAIGSPVGLYLLKYLPQNITHIFICLIVIFFSFLLMKGYLNKKLNNLYSKIITGGISGTVNGFATLGGMPVALFLLVIGIQPAVIRASLAALFFLTDIYAFTLSYTGGIVDLVTFYRTIPLIIILPIGVFIGNKFFIKSKEETYRKAVFYFLIVISIIGILRVLSSF